jgi:hypothetical protein
MNKDQQRFNEQDAPLKNTDHAFVKVKEDGSPDKRVDSSNQDKMNEESRKTTAEESSVEKGRS